MLLPNGEALLKEFSRTYPETVTEVVPGIVYHVMGYGQSNASFIIGKTSVTLVDTLDTYTNGEHLRRIIGEHTSKPVRTIIYTHGHPDHIGGSGVFADTVQEVIAFAPVTSILARSDRLNDVQMQRGLRQFGNALTDDEAISQGFGPRNLMARDTRTSTRLAPTTVYSDAQVNRTIDGVQLTLRAAPGETDDQIFVWLEDLGVLFCGDNYYGCWPNLYAIRGGQYRDIATWIDSLDAMRALSPSALLPGHTRPILGESDVADTLTTYRNALDFVLNETLECMNRGLGIEETADAVRLPDHLCDSPILGEFYGTVAWSVRSIYTAYLGWFDGNPTNLNPLPPRERAERTVAQMGGTNAVLAAIESALRDSRWQWASELADYLLILEPRLQAVRAFKAAALLELARMETSANGRHYYIACAKELLETVDRIDQSPE